MTEQQRAAARERLAQTKRVLADTSYDPERAKEALEHSYEVDAHALPILRRAGYLR